jgi:DMSO reductase anchor subunit
MNEWLGGRTVLQFGLMLWVGGVLCILLVVAVSAWVGGRPFDLALFLGLAIAIPLVGLPLPVWQQRQRRRASRRGADALEPGRGD